MFFFFAAEKIAESIEGIARFGITNCNKSIYLSISEMLGSPSEMFHFYLFQLVNLWREDEPAKKKNF